MHSAERGYEVTGKEVGGGGDSSPWRLHGWVLGSLRFAHEGGIRRIRSRLKPFLIGELRSPDSRGSCPYMLAWNSRNLAAACLPM